MSKCKFCKTPEQHNRIVNELIQATINEVRQRAEESKVVKFEAKGGIPQGEITVELQSTLPPPQSQQTPPSMSSTKRAPETLAEKVKSKMGW